MLIRDSNFFYNSFNETRTEDRSPDFSLDNASFSDVSPELLQLQRSRFREMPAPKRTAPSNEQQQQNKRPRRSGMAPLERLQKTKRILFKPSYVSRARCNPPGFQRILLTPETQHAGADSRPCSPQSQEIQRIMGRWQVTRPESCCFVPLSPCLPFSPRGSSLHNKSAWRIARVYRMCDCSFQRHSRKVQLHWKRICTVERSDGPEAEYFGSKNFPHHLSCYFLLFKILFFLSCVYLIIN